MPGETFLDDRYLIARLQLIEDWKMLSKVDKLADIDRRLLEAIDHGHGAPVERQAVLVHHTADRFRHRLEATSLEGRQRSHNIGRYHLRHAGRSLVVASLLLLILLLLLQQSIHLHADGEAFLEPTGRTRSPRLHVDRTLATHGAHRFLADKKKCLEF